MPLRLHAPRVYGAWFAWAERALTQRDPEDAHALALAAMFGLPLWTNDRDLQGHGIVTYTTAQLIRELAQQRGG